MLSVLFFAAMPWPPPEMPSEADFKKIQLMAKEAVPHASPKAVKEALGDPLTPPATEAEISKAMDHFKDAWFIGTRFDQKQQVEIDTFFLPSKSQVRVTWKSATGAKGQLLAADAPKDVALDDAHTDIALSRAEDVTRAEAKVTVSVPTAVQEAILSCKEPGAKQMVGALNVTLVACDNDTFSVLGDDWNDADEVTALNADKKPLQSGESAELYLFSGKSIDQVSYEVFKKGPDKAAKHWARAQGKVAFVRVARASASKKIDLDVSVLPEASQQDFSAKSRPRYVLPGEDAHFVSLLTPPLKLQSDRSCAMMGYNAPEIVVVFPDAPNSRLAKAELAPPKVKGGKGKFQLTENGLDSRHPRYYWTLETEDKVFSFAQLSATATVKYPAVIETVNGPHEGITIDGNKVSVAESLGELVEFSSSLPAGFRGLRAFDASGGELKSFNQADGNGEATTYAFMGQVARVQLNVIKKWVTKTISATLKPSPLRPKDAAGDCN